jgi:hypothetical protein
MGWEFAKILSEDDCFKIGAPFVGEVQVTDLSRVNSRDNGPFDRFELAVVIGGILPRDDVLADGDRDANKQNRRTAQAEVTDMRQARPIKDEGSRHRKLPEAFPFRLTQLPRLRVEPTTRRG